LAEIKDNREPFVGGALDVMASGGSVGVDERGALGEGRAALEGELDRFVHHLRDGRAIAVSGHCLFHPSIISRYPHSISEIATGIPREQTPGPGETLPKSDHG
jgi:hypothetical protein